MHEFSLVKKEVERAAAKINGKKASKVIFLLGKLTHGTPQSIKEAFRIAAANTSLSKAKLEVVRVDPKVKCSNCARVFSVDKEVRLSCPDCRSQSHELVSGEECYIDSIEVES